MSGRNWLRLFRDTIDTSRVGHTSRLRLENLEDRATPAITTTFSSGVLTLVGDGANDLVIVEATATPGTINYFDGNGIGAHNQAGVTQVIFTGNGGADELRLSNAAPYVFAPSGGIQFDGGGQSGDLLRVVGGSAAGFSTGTHTPTSPTSGTISHTTTSGIINISYSNIGGVVDATITGGAFTANATSGSENVAVIPNGALPAISGIEQGPVVIDGGDRDDHGFFSGGNQNGWLYMQQVLAFINNARLTTTPAFTNHASDILAIGVDPSTQAANAINSAASAAGLNVTLVNNAAISSVNFNNYDIIYVPSNNANTSGGISGAELDLLAARKLDIQAFANGGGGIFALTDSDADIASPANPLRQPYAWLELPLAFTIFDFTSGGISRPLRKTPAAIAAGLTISDAALSLGTPYHNSFTGPVGFNNLQPWVLDNGANGIVGDGDDQVIALGLGALHATYGAAPTSTIVSGSAITTITLGNKGSINVNTLGGVDTITVNGSTVPLLGLAGPVTIDAGSNAGDNITVNTQAAPALTGNIVNAGGNLGITGYAPSNINITPSISSLRLLNKGSDSTNINSYPPAFAPQSLIVDNISGGSSTVRLNAPNLINNATELTVAGNAIFDVQTNSDTVSRVILDGGTINGTTGVLTSTNTIQTRSGTANAILAGTNGLTQSTSGTSTLAGTNTYTGTTTINGGTLSLSNGAAIQDNGAVVLNNGALNLVASETIGSLAGAASTSVTLNNNTLTTGGNNTSTTYAGTISGAGGNLIKQGTGTFQLTGTNTYMGYTDVNVGTLLVDGSNIGTGPVNANAGATLGGLGLIAGQVNGNANGTVAPGSPVNSTESLNTGNLNMLPTSTLSIQLNGTTPVTQYDQMIVTGSVTLGVETSNLTLSGTLNPAIGQTFKIIDNDTTTDLVSGTFVNLLQGAAIYKFFGTGLTAHINYQSGDGNDVHITLKVVEVMPNGDVHVYGNNQNNEFWYDQDVNIPGNVRIFLDGYYYGSYLVPVGNVLRTFGGDGVDSVRITGTTDADVFTIGADVAQDSLRDKIFNLNGVDYMSHEAESYFLRGLDGADTFLIQGLGFLSTPDQTTNVTIEGGNDDDIIDTSALTAADVAGGATAGVDVLLQGPQRGVIEGVLNFNTIQGYVGGALNESVTFTNGGSLPGSTLGNTPVFVGFALGDGLNTFDQRGQTGPTTMVSLPDGTLNTSYGSVSGADVVYGTNNLAADLLFGAAQPNTWNVTAPNTLSYISDTNPVINFFTVESLFGGASTDVFNMGATGSVSGSIDGMGDIDQINYSTRLTPVTVGISPAKTTSVTGTWANIESFVGGSALNTLTASGVANTWTLTGANDGTLNGYSFTDFGRLNGGAAADNFVLGASGQAVSIAGGSGMDTLSYLGTATTVTVNVTSTTNGNGTRIPNFSSIESVVGGSGADVLNGTASGDTLVVNGLNAGTLNSTMAFTDFENLNGAGGNDKYTISTTLPTPLTSINANGGTDTLIGSNANNVYTMTGAGNGIYNGTMTFFGIENLTAGTGADTFDLTSGSIPLAANGGSGSDTLNVGTGNVNLATKVATGVGTTFANFENFVSSGGTLTGTNTSNTWRLTALDTGILNSTTFFTGFANVNGGSAQDRLLISTGGLSGTFNAGGSLTDIIDYSGVGTITRPYAPTVTGLVQVTDGILPSGLLWINGFELLTGNL